MNYDPEKVVRSYTKNAESEDQAEKDLSLRTEIPRAYINRYINPSDTVLDAGGGVGINAIMTARICKSVTLLDITPQILELARKNIDKSGLHSPVS